jgi:hypothetical protein
MQESKMFPIAIPDVNLLAQQRRRHREMHTTVAASYEVAARVHAELAAKLEAAGHRDRARHERELAAERNRMARLAHQSAAVFAG